jgi:hypothetical protein
MAVNLNLSLTMKGILKIRSASVCMDSHTALCLWVERGGNSFPIIVNKCNNTKICNVFNINFVMWLVEYILKYVTNFCIINLNNH